MGSTKELFETLAAKAAPKRIGEAGRGVARVRRHVERRPVNLEELVPDDHRVRAIWRFVEGLDLLVSPIKFLEERPGHPAADVLVKKTPARET